jgi:hypothetical protein
LLLLLKPRGSYGISAVEVSGKFWGLDRGGIALLGAVAVLASGRLTLEGPGGLDPNGMDALGILNCRDF